MSGSPRVTVLMPVRNGERYLGEALDSILGQTFRDFEFLVIDDGSTDRTGEILSKCGDERLRVVRHHSGVGVAATLNEGLRLARTEYVVRMDADDVSRPGRVEAQVLFMDRNPEVGICGTWIRFIGEEEGTVIRYPGHPDAIRCLLLFNNALAHPAAIFRREMLEANAVAYDPGCLHAEDYDLWVRASRRFRLANIPRVLLDYRVHEGQVWSVHEREQERSSAMIRGGQLERLGFAPSEDEVALHEAICNRKLAADRSSVERARSWLERLRSANELAAEYPEPAFASVLGSRWFEICAGATRLGWWTRKAFRSSPLCRAAGPDRVRDLKFGIKCVLGIG